MTRARTLTYMTLLTGLALVLNVYMLVRFRENFRGGPPTLQKKLGRIGISLPKPPPQP